MAKQNNGKTLEQAVHSALLEHQTHHKSGFIRFHDATSSGGRGHAQKGDFLWLLSKAVLIECKSTETGADLITLVKKSKTSREQVARHRLWHVSGHPSIYIHADLITREVKAYCGESVVDKVQDSRKTLKLVGVSGLSSVEQLLTDIQCYLDGGK